MCNCKSMVRVPDLETENGRWPIPHHHPNCEDFKTEKFYRITSDGTSAVFKPMETLGMFDQDDEFEIETVYLTQDQYESLPEFQGW